MEMGALKPAATSSYQVSIQRNGCMLPYWCSMWHSSRISSLFNGFLQLGIIWWSFSLLKVQITDSVKWNGQHLNSNYRFTLLKNFSVSSPALQSEPVHLGGRGREIMLQWLMNLYLGLHPSSVVVTRWAADTCGEHWLELEKFHLSLVIVETLSLCTLKVVWSHVRVRIHVHAT